MTAAGFDLIAEDLNAHGIVLDSHRREALGHFADLLEHWNRRINLVGTRDPAILWRRHVLDCLMLESVPREPGPRHWVDVGSGGGLPGIVLAIVHPEHRITAVESVARKATFLHEAGRRLGLANFHPVRCDAWQLADRPDFLPADVLVARAFGPLEQLLGLGRTLLRPGGQVWAMKGRRWEAETTALPAEMRATYAPEPIVHPYRLGAQAAGVVLVYRLATHDPTAA